MNKFFVKYKPNKAQAVQYAYGEGLEDGLALLVDVVTNVHLFSSNIIKVETNEGTKCPYIKQKRGRTFINDGDYIILEEDGSKHVVSEEMLWSRFDKCDI